MRQLLVVLLTCVSLALAAVPASAAGQGETSTLKKPKPKPTKKAKKAKMVRKKKAKKAKMVKKGKKKLKKAPPRKPGKTSIPVQIGIGPAIHMITGPVQSDQLFHYGLKTYASAIIDNETIRANKRMIPKKFRSSILKAREIRISPMILALIPDTIFISPKINRTQMFGAVFRPVAFGISPLSNNWFRFDINAGLLLMYAYLESSDERIGENHLLDPGLDMKASLEFKLHRSFLLTLGWASQVYIPMELGGEFWKVGTKNSFWHVGQAFLLLNLRFPYNHQF